MTISDRLSAGEILLLDGAIGTELEKHGIPEVHDASWAECLESHPDTVLQVHRDYVRAGVDILTTNTYSSGPGALTRIGQADKTDAWNRRAVDLARKASEESTDERTIYLAGSISAFGNGAMRNRGRADGIDWGESDSGRIRDNFHYQAEILVAAGVDLILLEMLGATLDDIRLAIEATADSGLPVCLAVSSVLNPEDQSLCLQISDGTSSTARGPRLGVAMDSLDLNSLLAFMIHHLETPLVAAALAEVTAHWMGPVGVYPNRAGAWNGKHWEFDQTMTPEGYAEMARQWIESGANIVGGCCGISPDHIAAVRDVMRSR